MVCNPIVKFLRVLVNNLISASRKAEGAWGARALGQLLMQTYPQLGVLREDILGTGNQNYLPTNCVQKSHD